MKLKLVIPFAALLVVILACTTATNSNQDKQNHIENKNAVNENSDEPWRKDQLMEPSDLSKIIINTSAKKPIIYSVGPGANIKGCIEMGPAQEKENLDKLKTALSKLEKNAEIVILCGCCPFEHCPNIRPSFTLLNEMKFTNHKLLNLPKNLKVDWIDKGYPMND